MKKPAQDLSGEIPIPSADETLTNPEISLVPSGVIPSTSIPDQFSQGASSSCGVKRPYTENTTMSNSPGASSDCDAKRVCRENTALPNSTIISMGSGMKRTHEKDPANDDEEQPGSRAWISTLIAGLHGVDIAEDDEICNGNEVPAHTNTHKHTQSHTNTQPNATKRKHTHKHTQTRKHTKHIVHGSLSQHTSPSFATASRLWLVDPK